MTINPSGADATPAAVRRSLIMVLASLPLGVTLFAAVVFWLRRGGSYAEVSLLYEIWAVETVVAIAAAGLFWIRMVRPHLPTTGFRSEPDPVSIGKLQTGLIFCMALGLLWPRPGWFGLC